MPRIGIPEARPAVLRTATFLFALAAPGLARAAEAEHGDKLGAHLPLWTVLPFLGILLSIAMFPLFAPKWWHRHFPKVSAFWGGIFAVPFLIVFRGQAIYEMLHVLLLEYIPFIILLWALFTIAGGIHVKGTLRGSPPSNLVLLIIGTAIASWVGTTGASMILIRPVLRANAWRRHKVHIIVFFLFLVSNIGGSLTPLGDPPLFLGFLLGVPFFWTLKLLPHMGFVSAILLAIFFALDNYYYRKEEKRPDDTETAPIRIEGAHNILLLGVVVGGVLQSGLWHGGTFAVLGIHMEVQNVLRDLILIAAGAASLMTTRKEIHEANEFSWFPIKEVAYLFAGIFVTIIPALAILKAGEEGGFGAMMAAMTQPGHYFWVTGSLSSFLDNAPTYLTFFNSLLGKFFAGVPQKEAVARLIAEQPIYLKAISIGAVFMGAMTYIGNAPNFMVRSIAEEAGVRMPSFFGFMVKYSIPILIPLFLLCVLIFL